MNITVGKRFARLTTNVVTRNPRAWRLFRPLMERQFGELAPQWDDIVGVSPDHLAAHGLALDSLSGPPRRVLDLGTGTGAGAFALASRFPEAEIVGVDLAPEMIAHARRKLSPKLAQRVRFEVGDAASLPFESASFDLVSHANMIPFFDELARVLARGGNAVFSFSGGAETPIYVPFERLRAELTKRGFSEFAEFESGRATALLAHRGTSS